MCFDDTFHAILKTNGDGNALLLKDMILPWRTLLPMQIQKLLRIVTVISFALLTISPLAMMPQKPILKIQLSTTPSLKQPLPISKLCSKVRFQVGTWYDSSFFCQSLIYFVLFSVPDESPDPSCPVCKARGWGVSSLDKFDFE